MSAVVARGVSKRFGAAAALDDISLTCPDGGFFALLGPSGSGKTTLLRAVAGFVEPDRGEILIDGRDVAHAPAHKRNIGMVFQNYALFPHLTVFDNVAFGLSIRRVSSADRQRRAGRMLDLVRLSGLERRKPRQLSGGQQQRVALARALVTEPGVLLLDEPLGALDKRLRQEMQIELKQIQRTVGITTIFVTHDQEEALTLADRVAIINEGRLVQVGEPGEVYERPRTVFAAHFLGDANLLRGRVARGRLALEGCRPVATTDVLPAEGEAAVVAVRPEKMRLGVDRLETDSNGFEGRIVERVFSGTSVTYLVRTPAGTQRAFVQNSGDRRFAPGEAVAMTWSPRHTVVLEP